MSSRVRLVFLVAALLLAHPNTGSIVAAPLGLDTSTASVVAEAPQLRTIMFPVALPASYADTFGACRDGCSRAHQGVDIFAPRLTPLIAATDGWIVGERRNATNKAGNKVVIEDADGWRYSYLHLNNDTPGTDDNANPQSWIIPDDLRAGDRVRAGQVIGYLGDSGNAEETPPHLHFEISPPASSAVNPTPTITAARQRGNAVSAAELAVGNGDRAEWDQVVLDAYGDLAGREPTAAEQDAWTNRLALGLGTETDLIADLAMAAPFREPEGAAMRGYVVAFSRLPSENLLSSLADEYRAGASAEDIAARIAASDGPQGVRSSWGSGNLEADEIAALIESEDIKVNTWHLFQILRAYRATVARLPTTTEIDAWTEHLELGGLMVDVVAGALDGTVPTDGPRHAGAFGPSELGYQLGETVRQGPVDLNPATDVGDGGRGTRAVGEAELDVALSVDEGDDGADVANLTVRIPLDELAAASDGDAELTIELSLKSSDEPGDDAEAEADVELIIVDPNDGSGDAELDPSADDADLGPVVSVPTTRRPIPRSPSPVRPTPVRPTPPPARPTTTAGQQPTTTIPAAGSTTAGPEPAEEPETADSPPAGEQPATDDETAEGGTTAEASTTEAGEPEGTSSTSNSNPATGDDAPNPDASGAGPQDGAPPDSCTVDSPTGDTAPSGENSTTTTECVAPTAEELEPSAPPAGSTTVPTATATTGGQPDGSTTETAPDDERDTTTEPADTPAPTSDDVTSSTPPPPTSPENCPDDDDATTTSTTTTCPTETTDVTVDSGDEPIDVEPEDPTSSSSEAASDWLTGQRAPTWQRASGMRRVRSVTARR
jgi:hypothetical protein